MPRYHNINGNQVQFTAEEETARDNEEAAWANAAPARALANLRDKRDTGFSFLNRLEEQVEGFKVHTLKRNHRHEIVTPILEVYRTFRD